MLHHWIFDKDLHDACRENLLDSLVSSPRTIERKVESAIGMIISDLADRYDTSLIFFDLKQWKSSESVAEGEHRYIDDVFYRAKTASTGKRPNNNPTEWEEADPRNQTIVSCVVDLTLWHLFKGLGIDRIPESVQETYDIWERWLRDVRKGMKTPDLPLKENGTVEVRGGSDEQKEWTY